MMVRKGGLRIGVSMEERNEKQKAKEKTPLDLNSAKHEAIDNYLRRSEARPFVQLKISHNENGEAVVAEPSKTALESIGSADPKLSINIGYALLSNAVGYADPNFIAGIANQLIQCSSEPSYLDQSKANFL